MKTFKEYLFLRESFEKIDIIAEKLVENQNYNQSLEKAKGNLMQTFQQEFQKNPQGALMWLDNLYKKVLPGDYKNFYGQYQKVQQPQQQQQPQQNQQLNQQQQKMS